MTKRLSYEKIIVFKKTILVLNFLVAHYLNSDCRNTVVNFKLSLNWGSAPSKNLRQI